MERRQLAFGLAPLAHAVSEGGTGGEITDLLDGDLDRQGQLTMNQSKGAVLLVISSVRCANCMPNFHIIFMRVAATGETPNNSGVLITEGRR